MHRYQLRYSDTVSPCAAADHPIRLCGAAETFQSAGGPVRGAEAEVGHRGGGERGEDRMRRESLNYARHTDQYGPLRVTLWLLGLHRLGSSFHKPRNASSICSVTCTVLTQISDVNDSSKLVALLAGTAFDR